MACCDVHAHAQDEDDVTPLLLAYYNEHKDIALMLVGRLDTSGLNLSAGG